MFDQKLHPISNVSDQILFIMYQAIKVVSDVRQSQAQDSSCYMLWSRAESLEGVNVHVFQATPDLKIFQNEGDWILYLVGLLRSLIICNHNSGVFPLDAIFNECTVSCGRRLSNHSFLWRFDCDLEF